MVKLLIIADDFTGALDTAVQFVNKGIETLVFTGKSVTEATVSVSAEVLVVDAETRRMTSKEAYTTVLTLVRQALEAGVKTIYKKTDSALRGNVGSELHRSSGRSRSKPTVFHPCFSGTSSDDSERNPVYRRGEIGRKQFWRGSL